MKIQNNYNVKQNTFKSGLTPAIREKINSINVATVEREFRSLNVDCKLKNNKAYAGMLVYTTNLLDEATQKYKLPFSALPPRIRVYNSRELTIPEEEECTGFCLNASDKTLKNHRSFETGSIFLNNMSKDIDFFDKICTESHKVGFSSSDHFMSDVLHEFFHLIHFDIIFKNQGYEGSCPYAIKKYENPNIQNPSGERTILDYSQKLDLFNRLRTHFFVCEYASTSKLELFAEVMTKIFADSIDPKTMTLKNNPMDNLKQYPKFVRSFIEEQLML